jgi:hypothetical protein
MDNEWTRRIAALEAAVKEKDEDYAYLKQLFATENKAHNEWMNKAMEISRDNCEKQRQIASMKEHTWCAYCGHEIHIDDEAATKISEHIVLCEKHPIHIAFAEIEKQREQIAALTATLTELRKALSIAALAIEIASDWGVPNVQVDPPKDWTLEANGEDVKDGWCSTSQLASKLKEIAQDALKEASHE